MVNINVLLTTQLVYAYGSDPARRHVLQRCQAAGRPQAPTPKASAAPLPVAAARLPTVEMMNHWLIRADNG